jgi:hypothetical protein
MIMIRYLDHPRPNLLPSILPTATLLLMYDVSADVSFDICSEVGSKIGVEWLKLYFMWKGLVDQYMPPSVAPSVPTGQRQRRPRADPIPPPHRPAKQPKA